MRWCHLQLHSHAQFGGSQIPSFNLKRMFWMGVLGDLAYWLVFMVLSWASRQVWTPQADGALIHVFSPQWQGGKPVITQYWHLSSWSWDGYINTESNIAHPGYTSGTWIPLWRERHSSRSRPRGRTPLPQAEPEVGLTAGGTRRDPGHITQWIHVCASGTPSWFLPFQI